MSIKLKILIPMIILIVVSFVVLLSSNIMLFSGYADDTLNDKLDTAAAVAASELDILKVHAENVSLRIAEDPFIMEPIIHDKPEALLTRATKLLESTGADFCTITDANGLVLARAHEPGQKGDDISAQANVQAALSGKTMSVVERGVTIPLAVFSGTPIYDNKNTLVGVVSAGFRLDTDGFVDTVQELLHCETVVFLGDQCVASTALTADGVRAVGMTAAAPVSSAVLAGGVYTVQEKLAGRDALVKYIPLSGPDDTIPGMLAVGRYISEKTGLIGSFLRTGLLVMVLLLVISITVILLIVRRIVAPVGNMVRAAHALAEGDTDIKVSCNTRDEMHELAQAFNMMIENSHRQTQIIEAIAEGDLSVALTARSDRDLMSNALITLLQRNNDVFWQINASAHQVSEGARQISDSAQSLAHGSTEQAEAMERLLATAGQVENDTRENAGMARRAAALTDKIMVYAEEGSGQMGRMVNAVKDIDESSRAIGHIIKVIDDIAFQTNILALNASVEAARAGQHGKGFAVVAGEVRNLATKSAAAAQNTGALIENSLAKAKLGVDIADETAASLDQIVAGINDSGRIVGEIAQSSEKQSGAISQIKDGIAQISQIVQNGSAAAEESAAASQEMSSQANILEGLVGQFRLRDEERKRLPRGREQEMMDTYLN